MSSRHTMIARRAIEAMAAPPSTTVLPPHIFVMMLVFVGALVVGYLLLPDENERIAMLERDGHDQQALQILEQHFAAGDRGHRTLFQLQSLYEAKGDLARARQTLELLATARPRDATVQRRLAEFYRITQDEPGYIRVLEARLAARFSQPVCKELIGLYRRAGQYDDEQRVLGKCRANGYRRTDDIIRLAHLTAADGKLAEAAVLLRSVDDRRTLRLDSDRLMLFAALLEAGAADEAKRRAARWFKGSKDDTLVLQIIDTLASDNEHALALDLAREVGRPGDSISLAVAELMLDRDEIDAARSYLAGWLARAKLTDGDLAQRALRAALEAEDPLLAYRAAQMHGADRLLQDDLVALAEALSAIDRPTEFQAVKALITPSSLSGNLLLAAAVEVEEGKPEPARQLLSRIQVKALDDWRLALWARLMASTGRKATAQQTLRDIAAEVRSADERVDVTPPSERGDAPVPVAPSRPRIGASAPPERRTPAEARPGVGAAPTKLVRRQRLRTDRQAPRRSRLKRVPAPTALPGPPPPLSTPVPFPAPG